ncbi:MAG TPA: class I SAM-dependent methyltransferase [Anaerolineales bacterium]
MNLATVQKLLSLNRQFYQSFADQFSETRQRLQPGVRKIIESVSPAARLLDLGCGNGELARNLAKRRHTSLYIGVDFSPRLLSMRPKDVLPGNFTFIQADLASHGWAARVRSSTFNLTPPNFDLILAFAVLHHLPGEDLRRQVLGEALSLLAPGGRFIHSEWQFLNSPRLRQRIQSWETAGLLPADVEPGDYLLDWRRGGSGLRYVHHFEPEELASLAEATGFQVLETFFSDGEGGRLGLYQVWEKIV